jgi:hypothetical protein
MTQRTAAASSRGSARSGPGVVKTKPAASSFQELVDAERWRSQFLGALLQTDDPAGLHEALMGGIEKRRWIHLKDGDGSTFRSFESFCSALRPFGLDTNAEAVRGFLSTLLGTRTVERLTVRPAHQGARCSDETSRQNGGKSDREEHRLRAVQERAPEVVRHLCDLDILPLAQAAWFGPRKPDQERKLAIERFAERAQQVLDGLGDARDETTLTQAKEQILAILPIPKPSRVDAAMRHVRGLNPDELESFLERLRGWLVEHSGQGLLRDST